MLILSVDSSGRACAACVWQDGKILAQNIEPMERGQDARLIPLIQEVMAKAGIDFPALDRIAVTRGPGSFTGLRIGLAAARGLGLAANKPVIGIDRFSVYRERQKAPSQNLLIVLDSKRDELFCRLYLSSLHARRSPSPLEGEDRRGVCKNNFLSTEPNMLTPEQIAALAERHAPLFITGDANDILRRHMPKTTTLIEPAEPEVVTCAMLAAKADPEDPACLPRPLYLRAPDVTVCKPLK